MDVIEDQNLISFGKAISIHKSRVQTFSTNEDRSKIEGFISRRGAELALKHLCVKLGSSLFDKLPKLWDCLNEVLRPVCYDDNKQITEMLDISNRSDPQVLINNIQVVYLQIIAVTWSINLVIVIVFYAQLLSMVDESLKPRLLTLLPSVLGCVRHHHAAVRLAASRGLPPPSGLSESLSRNSEDLQFLEQLLDNSHIDDYQIPVDIKVILRRGACHGSIAQAGHALHSPSFKDEVLSDLPEKIIQDRYCDLTPLQLRLYEQFSRSTAKREISSLVTASDTITETVEKTSVKATTHVFQALQYLLKLCSHPLLVIGDKPPDSLKSLLSEFIPSCDVLSELHELHHSPKLVALQEILEECGIGNDSTSLDGAVSVGHHRVLIFAQHRSLLDLIEMDLFHAHMKSVTYLRLDGSVEPDKRFDIVKTFNSDPTIDVLLLTTHVGGLGLNLTSADTLVFMEHDWNPMKDHQAMDRAHRLGQRKVVNVHRLIMRGTLEEKVMSLQQFKLSVANAVINAENASLKTMNTDQLLDLFTPASTSGKVAGSSSGSNGDLDEDSRPSGKKGLKSILSGLEELWDQSQYADEYNMSHFLEKING
ncbi:hypothetical protein HPP92_015195 [Vanilla planifolia]|uniref:Helicase C-terminal domain-containing protein n=1 Tax=Vanilla planifolia TaxID=51239 RepID=A0A835UTU0_VANPL|nr:hypothetical protein HPP92_015195 [Vanilla planifolia]